MRAFSYILILRNISNETLRIIPKVKITIAIKLTNNHHQRFSEMVSFSNYFFQSDKPQQMLEFLNKL